MSGRKGGGKGGKAPTLRHKELLEILPNHPDLKAVDKMVDEYISESDKELKDIEREIDQLSIKLAREGIKKGQVSPSKEDKNQLEGWKVTKMLCVEELKLFKEVKAKVEALMQRRQGAQKAKSKKEAQEAIAKVRQILEQERAEYKAKRKQDDEEAIREVRKMFSRERTEYHQGLKEKKLKKHEEEVAKVREMLKQDEEEAKSQKKATSKPPKRTQSKGPKNPPPAAQSVGATGGRTIKLRSDDDFVSHDPVEKALIASKTPFKEVNYDKHAI